MANRIYTDPTQPGRYHLEHDSLPPVSIRYNESTHSVRLQDGDERRVFMLEPDGSSGARHGIYNEYGIRAGSCQFEDSRHTRGTVRWEGVKFRFRCEGKQLQLMIGGKIVDQVQYELPADASPEAAAGIIALLCREEIVHRRVAV